MPIWGIQSLSSILCCFPNIHCAWVPNGLTHSIKIAHLVKSYIASESIEKQTYSLLEKMGLKWTLDIEGA